MGILGVGIVFFVLGLFLGVLFTCLYIDGNGNECKNRIKR